MKGFGDIIAKCGVLFSADDSYAFDEKAVAKTLDKNDGEGYEMLKTLSGLLAGIEDWSAEGVAPGCAHRRLLTGDE